MPEQRRLVPLKPCFSAVFAAVCLSFAVAFVRSYRRQRKVQFIKSLHRQRDDVLAVGDSLEWRFNPAIEED